MPGFDYLDRPFYGPTYPFAFSPGYMGDWWGPYSMYRTGGLGDISIGPHLFAPFGLGVGYAWGQGLGLWGQKDDPSSGGATSDGGPRLGDLKGSDRHSGGRDHRREHRHDHETDWSTIAWVGLGAVGVFGAIYLITRKQG